MSDQINKTLILSAKLDTSGISSELKRLKNDVSMDGLQLDQATIQSLKKDFAEIAKSFSAEINKAVRAAGGGGGRGTNPNVGSGGAPRRGSGKPSDLNNASGNDVQRYKANEFLYNSKEQNRATLDKMRVEKRQATDKAKEEQREVRQKARQEQTETKQALRSSQLEERKRVKEEQSKIKVAAVEERNKARENSKQETRKAKESKYYTDYRKSGNESAMSMPQEQTRIRKEMDERKKMQKQLSEDKEKRELGVAYRVGRATRNWIKTGKFDYVEPSQKADFRSKARGAGLELPEDTGKLGVTGRVLGQGGAAAMRMGGLALGVGAAAVGGIVGAGNLIRANATQSRESQSELANKRFELSSGLSDNNVLETNVRNQARKKVGFMEFMESQARGNIKDLVTGNWSDLRNNVGADAETSRRERQEGDLAVERSSPLLNAFKNTVKPTIGARADLLAGGSFTSESLTGLQGVGSQYGFGSQDALSRLTTGRQTLGNKFFEGSQGKSNFGEMSDLERRYGIDMGTSATNVEALRSTSSSGMQGGQALSLQREGLKKAVSAGLDASRTGKYLETTSSYISSNSGFGNMDLEGMSDSIINMARSFANQGGRDDITGTDLDRAKSAREAFRSDSMSMGGIAGAGNYLGVTGAMKDAGISDPGVLLAGMSLSSDADDKSISQMLEGQNLSDDQKSKFITSFRNSKQNTFTGGADALGLDDNYRTFLGSREKGISGESAQALNSLKQTGSLSSTGAETSGAFGSSEMKNLMNQSAVDFTQFSQAFQSINTENAAYVLQLKNLNESLKLANERAEAFLKNVSPQAARTFTGETLSMPRK